MSEKVANYAFHRCKILGVKIRLCKFFDKYHVCETPTTARFDNHWLLWSGSTQQLVSGATWLQWAPNEARLEWPSSTISSTPLVAETVRLVGLRNVHQDQVENNTHSCRNQDPRACAAWRATTRTRTSGVRSPICARGEEELGSVALYSHQEFNLLQIKLSSYDRPFF